MNIFVAAPLTGKLIESREGMRIASSFAHLIQSILLFLRERGHTVFSAHEREEWGADIFSPVRAIKLDLDGIERCDFFLALVGDPPSPGVQLELGYALALRKPICVVHTQQQDQLPHLVQGVDVYPNVTLAMVDDGAQWIHDIYRDLINPRLIAGATSS